MPFGRRAAWRTWLCLLPVGVCGCGSVRTEGLDRIRIRIAELRRETPTDAGTPTLHRLASSTPAASFTSDSPTSRNVAGVNARWQRSTAPTRHGAPRLRLTGWQVDDNAEVEARADKSASAGADDRSGPLPGFLDTVRRDLKAMPADLWQDIKAVYGSPANLAILGLSYGGSLALQGTDVDDSLADSLAGDSIFNEDANVTISVLGNPGTHLGLAGLWYLFGQQSSSDKTYNVGKTLFSALIISDLTALGTKLAVSDRSPNGERFSFPSGHTTSTFAVASVLHRTYGPWVGIPLYGLGVLVAVERLDDDEHNLSDVLMGSMIGLVIGHTVAGERDFKLYGGSIVPFNDPRTGSVGLAWHKRL